MEGKIRQALSESDSPMTALAIAKKIGFSKKEVNKTIYEMQTRGEVKRANDTNPPTWRLISDGASLQDSSGDPAAAETQSVAAASSSVADVPSAKATKMNDSELLAKILSALTASDKPLSAPDVARKVTADTSDVKRVLYEAEKDGKVENTASKGNKPLWLLKTSLPPQAQYDGKPVYTLETSSTGAITLNPITQDHIKKQAASINTTPATTNSESVETSSDSQEQPAAASTPSSTTADITGLEQSLADMAISSKLSDSDAPKTKPVPGILAAKFELSSEEKERVNELLRCNQGEHTSEEVKAGIGAESRDLVMVYLDELVKKGLVKKHFNTGPATYEWLGDE